ncbi:MAG TPA: tetratricopeptide repeat protein, partial [Thermodesulfobacteriota bacterium]|nr:tetratricopeptide repeat protein [Thermodesulfobacteriota bacterium]
MVQDSRPSIQIDLNDFKLHLHLKSRTQLTLLFNSPSRRFYLSVIALVVQEMKKLGKIQSVPLQDHFDLLVLLNESIGGAAGSSNKENLLHRIYTKWKDTLPNLEEAPLFKVLGKKKEEGDGASGKIYSFPDAEKDGWANLFEYMGSEESVRLKFAIDKIGVGLNEISIIFDDRLNSDAWDRFISDLKNGSKEVASVDRMRYPLPDKPSIAVLPFVNMSEDPKQEFICDAITDSIITALTKRSQLSVIARNSTFAYKGKPAKVKQVSEELGVQYVLEGSFQRSDDRVRVNAQLIDALTGTHLWAERYDCELGDIFGMQDEITTRVARSTYVKLTEGGDISFSEKNSGKYYRGKQELDRYLKMMQVTDYLDRWTIADTNLGRGIAEEAVALYPESPAVYTVLGWVYFQDYMLNNTQSPRETIEKGIELAQKALAMDSSLSQPHALLCFLYCIKREHDEAIIEGERAVALNPATIELNAYASALRYAGRTEDAIPVYQKAIRFNPSSPSYLYHNYAFSLLASGRLAEAVAAFKKAIQISPDSIRAHILLAATYSMMGREKEARVEAAEGLRINPKFSLENFAKILLFKDQSETDKIVNALRE